MAAAASPSYCADRTASTPFWSALLDRAVTDEHNGPDWVCAASQADTAPKLTFQRVPEPCSGKTEPALGIRIIDHASFEPVLMPTTLMRPLSRATA